MTICDNRNMHSRSVEKRSTGARLLLAFVHLYRVFLSPFLGGACKFYPSCSRYAEEAISLHGPARGAWLAIKRLGRCRPFTKGGFDPVPEPEFFPPQEPQAGGCTTSEPMLPSPHTPEILAFRQSANVTSGERTISETASSYARSAMSAQPLTSRAPHHRDADWLRTLSKGLPQ
jgi:uncharacterized protein